MTLMYAQKAFRDATEASDLPRMAAIFDAMTDLARHLVGTGEGMTAAQEAAWDKLDAIVNPNPATVLDGDSASVTLPADSSGETVFGVVKP